MFLMIKNPSRPTEAGLLGMLEDLRSKSSAHSAKLNEKM
jgi:hypothetical protein